MMKVGAPNMFPGMDISASALSAQRMRMNTIAQNMANINTTRDKNGNVNPYRRKDVIFAQGSPLFTNNSQLGVRVKEIAPDKSDFKRVYRPHHQDADKDGYVLMPNVDVPQEMVGMIEASRAYEANITAMESTKGMVDRLLRMLA